MASEKDKIRVEEKLNDILPDVEKTQVPFKTFNNWDFFAVAVEI